jgi:hypothetical protein
MNKLHPIIYIFIFFRLHGQEIGSREWVQDEARRIQNLKISEVTEKDLPETNSEDVIKELGKRLEWSLLIRLGDEETIDRLVSKYMEIDGASSRLRRTFIESKSPWLLPLLAPALESEEFPIQPRHYGEHGASDLGFAPLTAEIMGTIIRDSPEFPDAIRAETAKIQGLDPMHTDPWILAAMRDWWAANEALIKQERYTEVTPPTMEGRYEKGWRETYESTKASPESVGKEEKNATLPNKKLSPPYEASTPNAGSELNHSVSLEKEDKQGLPLLKWVILGAVSMSILVLVLKATRKSN